MAWGFRSRPARILRWRAVWLASRGPSAHWHRRVIPSREGNKQGSNLDCFVSRRWLESAVISAACPRAGPRTRMLHSSRRTPGRSRHFTLCHGSSLRVQTVPEFPESVCVVLASQTPPAERVAWWVGPPQRRLSRWLRRRAKARLRGWV